jgi:hypothetical protein
MFFLFVNESVPKNSVVLPLLMSGHNGVNFCTCKRRMRQGNFLFPELCNGLSLETSCGTVQGDEFRGGG